MSIQKKIFFINYRGIHIGGTLALKNIKGGQKEISPIYHPLAAAPFNQWTRNFADL